jgi:hypothetical protein
VKDYTLQHSRDGKAAYRSIAHASGDCMRDQWMDEHKYGSRFGIPGRWRIVESESGTVVFRSPVTK